MLVPGSSTPLLAHSAAAAATGISRSLRFNSSDSAFLSRTPAVAGNRTTFTWAGWVKRSTISDSVPVHIFSAGTSGASNVDFFGIETDNTIRFGSYNGSAFVFQYITTQVFRDPSAWYHLVLAVDTTIASPSSDRVKFYVNGVRVTTFSTATDPGPSAQCAHFNTTSTHYLGKFIDIARYFPGYLADIHFIDGQALTPSSFTEVSATTGQLIPKAYTGTFTGNSFWLKFADNSAATATTLGKDSSGLGNNWTPTNFSVTAGAGNDSLVDTPTSYGTDDSLGGSVRGNYATWNPTLHSLNGNKPNLSNGNLDQSGNISSIGSFGLATIVPGSGKWYMEATMANANFGPGIWKTPLSPSSYAYQQTNFRYFGDGNVYNQAGTVVASYSTFTTGDVIGVALDLDNGRVFFSKNGTWQGSSNPATGANPAGSTGIDATWTFGLQSTDAATGTCNANFGQRPFAYTAPSGFKALVDTNLPAPVVAKPNTVFDVKLYDGNGSTQTISGLGFSPDWVWLKKRSGIADHYLYDTIRGATYRLYSNTTDAESTSSTGLTAFTSTGFDLGSANDVNQSSNTYVAWCWDAGSDLNPTTINANAYSAGVPSITSSVRANASAGFSIVTYTGNGSNTATVGHGLNAAPKIYIVKRRSSADYWVVYTTAIDGSSDFLYLNATDAKIDDTFAAPTSTVFTPKHSTSGDFVAYCFAPVAGYSSMGSYVGNGSSDGPMVYTGFRPRWVMIKNTSVAAGWYIYDTSRDTYNLSTKILLANSSGAEYTDTDVQIDVLSNGFKLRSSGGQCNGSSSVMVYAAFAESPFNYARAR